MSLASQFSLSLELTRLIPLNLVGNAAAAGVLALARQLQNSGSDLIVEQDLAQIFGRSRIAAQMESNFRTMMLKKHPEKAISTDLRLIVGPGPTVVRSLKDRVYFSTVVQLSLLTSCYKVNDLAQVLVDLLDAKHQQLPHEYMSPPDPARVIETLTAIEEQTSTFSWIQLLRAICATLELPSIVDADIDGEIDGMDSTILTGLMDVIPLVQTLPLDRFVYIQGKSGFCPVVAWVHHVLGLTVKVKTESGKEVYFGTAPEQVYIEQVDMNPSISLYDSSGDANEILFVLHPDIENQRLLSSSFKIPIKGYGTNVLQKVCRNFLLSSEALEDMQLFIVAIACFMHNIMDFGSDRFATGADSSNAHLRITELACIVFNANISEEAVRMSYETYHSERLDEHMSLPASLKACFQTEVLDYQCPYISDLFRELATLILCLSFVEGAEDCEELRICDVRSCHPYRALKIFTIWDGRSRIRINESTIFELLVLLIQGDTVINNLSIERASLLSSGGWTIYLPTLNDADPASIEVDKIKVIRGVPYRNDTRIQYVTDGLIHQPPTMSGIKVAEGESAFTMASTPSTVLATRGKTMFSRKSNSCATSIPLIGKFTAGNQNANVVVRTSYYHLQGILWQTILTDSCAHTDQQPYKLPANCDAFVGHEGWLDRVSRTRGVVIITENSSAARWHALVSSVFHYQERLSVLLRTRGCCVDCAIAQANKRPLPWKVIL